MKANLFFLQLLLAGLFLFIFSCQPDPQTPAFSKGTTCNGTQILVFSDWSTFQSEYDALYNDYKAQDYDENVLLSWDNNNHFSSLLKKDYDMDMGNRPDENGFNPDIYSADDILQSFLNEDGTIIIRDSLYLWDDQCVVSVMNYNCNNYDQMLLYSQKVKDYEQNHSPALLNDISDLANQYRIEQITTCGVAKYDFRYLAENPGAGDILPNPNFKAGCGLDVSIHASIASNNPASKIAVIDLKAEGSSLGGEIPIFVWKLPSINSLNIVTITNTPNSTWNNTDWWSHAAVIPNTTIPIQPRFFEREWQITVDYTNNPVIDISLRAYFGLFSGSSCSASDYLTLDLDCPIFISKELIDREKSTWHFTLEGYQVPAGESLDWDFGDGTYATTTGQQDVIHEYTSCGSAYYDVKVRINNDMVCNNWPIVHGVWAGDPCKLSTHSYREWYKIDQKRVRLVIKMKLKWDIYLTTLTDNTKIKAKYKWRHGDFKEITTTGEIYLNSDCSQVNFASLTPIWEPDAQANWDEKKLVQIYKDRKHYVFDVRNPYEVTFSNSNTIFPSKTISFQADCIEQF